MDKIGEEYQKTIKKKAPRSAEKKEEEESKENKEVPNMDEIKREMDEFFKEDNVYEENETAETTSKKLKEILKFIEQCSNNNKKELFLANFRKSFNYFRKISEEVKGECQLTQENMNMMIALLLLTANATIAQ
ncbi:MAG: hypothetical protein MJ252_12580, partial [archaeon]|nr:hypothetical protein [archaeon]